jgi:hypothetical protein
MPEQFHGSPELLNVWLYDPRTHKAIAYEPQTHVAREQITPEQPEDAADHDSAVQIEDLGTTTLNGLTVRGTRRTLTVPRKASGMGRTINVVQEEWYSKDLHINLLVHRSDPRHGIETIGISDLKREPPPASMFDVPPGYQILAVSSSTAGTPHGEIPAPSKPEGEPRPDPEPQNPD